MNESGKHMIVMKFGGSSVGSGRKMLHVAEIIKTCAEKNDLVIIVSAMGGVTDKLLSVFTFYQQKNVLEGMKEVEFLYKIHHQALADLHLPREECTRVEQALINLFGQLSLYLTLHQKYSKKDSDYIVSFGERFSARLLAAAVCSLGTKAKSIDSAAVVVTTNEFGNAKAYLAKTKLRAKRHILPIIGKRSIPIVTGFFGATEKGEVTTFGRGGSDYSATILAHVLDAKEVILWKEVDGVYTSDPKKNSTATYLPELTYKQALDLAKRGAKVLHPEAMEPVAQKGIVVRVKNTFKPTLTGTKIWKGNV